MKESTSLKNKTISGLLWSFADSTANQGIQFFIQIILARLLLPEDFGIIGMVLVFIAISSVLVDGGFSVALIRENQPTHMDYCTIFFFNFMISVIIYGIIYQSAFTISSFFREPQLISILRVLSLVLIINSFGIIHRIILARKVDFKTQTKINIFAGVVSGSIAILLAVKGHGVWSLVIKTVSMQIFQIILLWIYIKWIPTFTFSIQSLKRLFSFSSKTLLSILIGTIYNNIYFVVIGRFYSPAQLGYYSNSVNLSNVFSNTLTASIQRVTYPVLSSIKEDDEKLRRNFKNIIKMSVLIVFPLMIGLATIADPLVNLLFGEKWAPSIVYLQLLCIAGMLHPLHAINSNILQVKGRSDLFLILEIIQRIIMTILIALALLFQMGILGLVTTVVLYSAISLFTSTYFSAKEVSYSIKEQFRDILPIAIATFVMGGVVYIIGMVLPETYLIKLIIQIGIGITVYVIICKILGIQELKKLFEMFLVVLHKTKN